MINTWGYDEYDGVAEFYDHVEPYRDRPDVDFYIEADKRHFELGHSFMLVTLPFKSFQHLTTIEDQCACLERIHTHLAEGGKLILDLFNPSLVLLASEITDQELGEEPEFTMPDGRRVVRKHRFVSKDHFNQVNHVELIYYVTHPDGREERLVQGFPFRYLFRYEAEHLLVRCRFRVEHVYGAYDKSPFGSKHPGELIMVAKKDQE